MYGDTHTNMYRSFVCKGEQRSCREHTKKNKKEEDGAFDLLIASGTWFDLLWVKHKWGECVETAHLVKLYIC